MDIEFSNTPPPVRPLQVRSEQAESFRFNDGEGANLSTYVTTRGLVNTGSNVPDSGHDYYPQGYNEVLPKFKDKTLIELIEERVQRGETPTILDLGYGHGNFLLDCRDVWQGSVNLQGYGSSTIPANERVKYGDVIQPATLTKLQEAGVELIDGDIMDLSTIYGHNRADLITSMYALMHVRYPQWELLKKVYRALKPGGIALLHWDRLGMSELEAFLGEYLKERGYSFEFGVNKVSFQKTEPDLDLPVRTARWHYFAPPELTIYDHTKASLEASRLP